MWFLAWVGCAGPFLPGEAVLGEAVTARVIEGPVGSDDFGTGLALGDGHLLVAEQMGFSLWEISGTEVRGADHPRTTRVGWSDGDFWRWAPGGGVETVPLDVGGEEHLLDAANASAVDRCADGTVVLVTGAGEDIACGDEGIIRTACTDTLCSVILDVDGEIEELDTTSAGSAVGWSGSAACWGDAMLGVEEGAGRVTCDDGTLLDGIEGEHLGLSLGGGYVAGRFNRHTVPPRLRIHPISGGTIWTIDSASENSRASIAGWNGWVGIGVPGYIGPDGKQGRVYLADERGR